MAEQAEQREYWDVDPTKVTLKKGGGDYIKVPDTEPLKAHISKVQMTMGTKYGTNEPEEVLSIGFTLDEGEDKDGNSAVGQVYAKWVNIPASGYVTPNSALGKIALALYGEIPDNIEVKDFEGRPCRIMLVTNPKNERQNLDLRNYPILQATKDQKVVKEESTDPVAAATKVFEGAEEVL